MAFVCTVSSAQHGPQPVIAASPTLTSLVYPIGYDDEDERIYQLFVSLGWAGGGIVEYSFCIICTHRDGVVEEIWDSQVLRNVISKRDRVLILQLLVEATGELIQRTNFPAVTMYTFLRDLPPRALEKYRYIAQLFRNAGYNVRTNEHRGQHTWWFEREGAPVAVRKKRRRRRRRR